MESIAHASKETDRIIWSPSSDPPPQTSVSSEVAWQQSVSYIFQHPFPLSRTAQQKPFQSQIQPARSLVG